MTRHLVTTLCVERDTGHVMGSRGQCVACGIFIPLAPVYTVQQRLRYEQMRGEWLHEQRALEKGTAA